MKPAGNEKLGRAFTLVELLVVISVIGLLMGILVPALGRARGVANRTYCMANLRQIGIAMRSYLDDNRDIFPRCSADPRGGITDPNNPNYRPPITKVLGPLLKEPKVFWCKADKQNFKECGTSYRYSSNLGGRTIRELMSVQLGEKERNISVLCDLDSVHPKKGPSGGVNYLYADWHVSNFENQE